MNWGGFIRGLLAGVLFIALGVLLGDVVPLGGFLIITGSLLPIMGAAEPTVESERIEHNSLSFKDAIDSSS